MFIDLSQAFDTVDHLILFIKPKLYGLEANNQSWIKNSMSRAATEDKKKLFLNILQYSQESTCVGVSVE